MAISKTQAEKLGTALVTTFDDAVSDNAKAFQKGAALRELTAEALKQFPTPIDAIAFLEATLATSLKHYLAKYARPAGGSLSAPVVAWRNTFTNPIRAMNVELDEVKTGKRLAVQWKTGNEKVLAKKKSERKDTNPIDAAISAIAKIEEGFSQPNADKLVAALISAGFKVAQISKAVGK